MTGNVLEGMKLKSQIWKTMLITLFTDSMKFLLHICPLASFCTNRCSVFGIYFTLACSVVTAARSPPHPLQRSPRPGPCGNNLEPLACSAAWLKPAVLACILISMYRCSVSRNKDALKQSTIYT